MKEHSHLFNELPFELRKKLAPYLIESQISHITQCRSMAIRNHKKHIKEMDDWIANLRREIKSIEKQP